MKEQHALTLPNAKAGSRIGFFGGSFDPPHLGHVMLALSFLTLEALDELWIVPCDDHAFKNSASSFAQRFAMCKLAFRHLKNTPIVAIEHHLKAPNFTINTIEVIRDLRPDLTLLIGLGSDLLGDFPKWHQAERLVNLAEFVIFEREHYPSKPVPELLNNARIHNALKLPDINSTILRAHIKTTNSDTQSLFIDTQVANYIKKNNLYR